MRFSDDVGDVGVVEAEYKESLRVKREAELRGTKAGTKLFQSRVKEFFAKHPVAETASWRQYTPYFNDGDACVFSVCNDDAEINGFDPYEEPDVDAETKVEIDAARSAFETLLGEFDTDLFLDMFGDHARVTVTPKGAKVEEYDHD